MWNIGALLDRMAINIRLSKIFISEKRLGPSFTDTWKYLLLTSFHPLSNISLPLSRYYGEETGWCWDILMNMILYLIMSNIIKYRLIL